MENNNLNTEKEVISAVEGHTKRTIKTRTKYVLVGADYSQQE